MILWNLVVKSLLTVETTLMKAILIKGKIQSVLTEPMNRTLEITNKWCQQNGLSLNANKAVIVPFTPKKKLDRLKPPKIMGEEIQLSKTVKYLVVMLDQRPNWKEHIQYITMKQHKLYGLVVKYVVKIR